ncbi:VOC family protein [Haloactinomyces albus]|uniref:Enzyme related to lactoylglutathione lyase n=1 Tax=Haloactinomyces albus TaxID=1352928 RepID=A0AAE4CMK6_9ACTN|nr:VOC family protein [Haloactinomyces albus]MDR7303490.1 putative enzyme related to lactoylglutathione lyase [Haloactinomyces albus]
MSPHTAVRGLRRTELITPDPETSVRFHRALLGWTVLYSDSGFDCWTGERHCAAVRTPLTGEQAGWRLVFAGATQDNGVLTDPGEAVAVLAKGRAQHGPWAPHPRRGEPCWIELCTDDAAQSDVFWTDTLSWTSEDASDGATYAAEGRPIAARASAARIGDRCGWLCYFTVDSLERAAEQVQELGGTLLERLEHPGVGETLVIADTSGAVSALTGKTETWGG